MTVAISFHNSEEMDAPGGRRKEEAEDQPNSYVPSYNLHTTVHNYGQQQVFL